MVRGKIIMPNMVNNNQINSHKLLYSEIKERLKDQFDSVDSLDTKAGVTLGFSGVILIGLVNSGWFLDLQSHFFLIVLTPLIIAISSLVASVFVRSYNKDPDPTKLIEGYKDKTEDETRRQLIRNFEDCFKKNTKPLKDKRNYLNLGFVMLGITVVMVCFTLFILGTTPQSKQHNQFKVYRWEVCQYGRYKQ